MDIDVCDEHRWLHQLLGEWDYLTEMSCAPGEPVQTFKGSERVRKLGELWVLCEGESDMPGGGRATMLMTLGYASQRGCFVGSWIGSMMSWMWRYEGQLDGDRKVLTLESEGPSFTAEGTLARYHDIITLKGRDERRLDSRVLGEDGAWHAIMQARYTRVS